MNKSFRSIWNQALGAWVAVPETARAKGGKAGSRGGATATVSLAGDVSRASSLGLAIAGALFMMGAHTSAYAACTTSGAIMSCTGASQAAMSSVSNLTVNVDPGATIAPSLGSSSVSLTGTGVTLNNSGIIDATFPIFSSAVVIDNAAGSTNIVRNYASGTIKGTFPATYTPTVTSLAGLALNVRNGAGGTTTFSNEGKITMAAEAGNVRPVGNAAAVALWGGARNIVANYGTIEGRVALAASMGGNSFTNVGTVRGSVSLGGNSSAPNAFYAITGSTIEDGGGDATPITVSSNAALVFAAAGTVDAGASNSAANTLYLQNAIGGGSGTGGTGTVSSAVYKNFNVLNVSSGTWSLLGGSPVASTFQLNGGALVYSDGSQLGTNIISSNGGELRNTDSDVVINNILVLGDRGLTLSGTKQVSLGTAIVGSGALTKAGTGTLFLNSMNAYTGGTVLQEGTLLLGHSKALGDAALTVSGSGTLRSSTSALTLTNAIAVDGRLNVDTDQNTDISLAGALSGAGTLAKTGAGSLALADNANTFSGTFQVDAGTLSISSSRSLGSAALSFGPSGRFTTSNALEISNSISLSGAMTLVNQDTLTLSGSLGGVGSLNKQGLGDLILNADNSNFIGGIGLQSGTLVSAVQGSLGSGVLFTSAGTTLKTVGDQTVGSLLFLTGNLSLESSSALSLTNSVLGNGGLTKNGSGTLTLAGNNSYFGATAINAGTLVVGAGVQGTLGLGSVTNNAVLAFNRDDVLTVNNQINGGGVIEQRGAGTLVLSGDSSLFAGTTKARAGSLQLDGTLGGDIVVDAGAKVSGSGTLLGNLDMSSGGILAGKQGQTLTVDGNLTLGADSKVNLSLGQAVFNDKAIISVGKDLALAGTLNIEGQQNFGAGVYSLFEYGGTLTSNTMALGTLPNGANAADLSLLTSVQGQVNLASTVGATLSYWDGDDASKHDNGVINGGAGTWRADGKNWTISTGQVNGQYKPNPTFAVFMNDGGTVQVDASAGDIGVTGMQIATNGYRIQGDSIALQGDNNETIIKVGMGIIYGRSVPVIDVTGTIDSTLTGDSKLAKENNGTLVLSGSNTYTGGTEIRAGALSVSRDANLGAASGAISINGGTLLATASFDSLRAVTLQQTGLINVASNATLTLAGTVSGNNDLQKLGSGTLVLTGTNYYGNTLVSEGTLVGNASSIRGNVSNDSAIVFNQVDDGSYFGAISGSGLATKTGAGVLTLNGNTTQDWNVGAGTLLVTATSYKAANTLIDRDGTLRFNELSAPDFTGSLAGTGTIEITGEGNLYLRGENSNFAGTTKVNGGMLSVVSNLGGSVNVDLGALNVNGTVGGKVNVGSQGTLRGDGVINGSTTINGGKLIGTQGSTLTFNGGLALSNSSVVSVDLGGLFNTGAGNTLFKVAGDLTLGGTLNVYDAGGFSAGVYRLFDYTGALTNNGMTFGDTPSGAADLSLQTAVANQVNLISTKGAVLSFWDGDDASQHDNGMINGGSGIWKADGRSWTRSNGDVNGEYKPNPTFAVFQGEAGTVRVAGNDIGVTGLQIVSNGYRIEGDAIALEGDNNQTSILVGTRIIYGRAVPADVTGTIASELTGDSKLVKGNDGTLILEGENSYLRGTEIAAGTLSISRDANLGAAAGGLTLNGGKLLTTASFDSNRAVTLAQAGAIEVAANTELGLKGAITGPGSLEKLGAGTLTLGGQNSYGNTLVSAGTLIGDAASISGDLVNNGAVVFNQTSDGSFGGLITGSGSYSKQGAGVLTLAGINTQAWTVDAGTLEVDASRYQSDALINSAGTLRFNQSAGNSYVGKLSGSGNVEKTGTGYLTMSGDNSAFTGTTKVQQGLVLLSGALGGSAEVTGGQLLVTGTLSGNVLASGDGRLAGSGLIGGNVTLDGGALAAQAGQPLTIAGDLKLSDSSLVNAGLGTPSANAVFKVGGNLTLAGTLDVTDIGGFGEGVYRIFDYAGALTNNGMTIGSTPSSVTAADLYLQTAVDKQVNLISTGGATLRFWDGGDASKHDNGAVDGGSGIWTASGRNWTDYNGALNGRLQPAPAFAIFQGASGTVQVDNSAGAVAVTGMQFASDGYRVQGDAIALEGAGGETIIRVGEGTILAAVDSAPVSTVNATIASELTGASKLVKTDTGTLFLTGNNSYSGGTDIRSGTLSVSRDANLGNTDGNLTLSGGTLATTASFDTARTIAVTSASAINVAGDTIFGVTSKLTGSGDLTKTGAGVLALSGNGSNYTGNTLISQGGLDVMADGKLGGKLTVASGAWLQGSGQVGTTTLQSGSYFAPGGAAGALKVAGDLTFASGTTFLVSADPESSTSSRVDVTGKATLGGSVVHIGPDGGFQTTREYTILTAGTISGTFEGVSSNYAYLKPTLSYSDEDVKMKLQRNSVSFEETANTSNQRSAARALASLPEGSALREFILTLPEGMPASVFNSLTGEAHASVVSNLMSGTSSPRVLPMSRLRSNLNAGMSPGAPTAQAGGVLSASALPSSNAQPAWAELVGNWQTQKDNGNSAEVRQHTGGVFLGADQAVGNSGWRLGGAVGYTDSKVRVDDRSSQADVSGYSATLYGGKSFAVGAGKLNFLAGAAYTWHDVNTTRYANVSGTQEKLTADYGANTTQLFTELGYAMQLTDRTRIEPFVGFAWSDLRTRGFSETGGSAALTGKSSSDKQTSSTLGVRSQTDVKIGNAEARLHATLGWRHAFGGLTPETTMAFQGSESFTVAGSPIARNAALAELGAEVAVSRDTSLGLIYSGQYGGGNREHSGSLNVRWRF